MPQTHPIDNPEYSRIILAIFSGNRRPKQLLKIFKAQSKNNLSMKLQQLIKLGFVSRQQREYFISPAGLMRHVAQNILSQVTDEKSEYIRRKYKITSTTFNDAEKKELITTSRACHRLLFCYLFQTSKQTTDIKESPNDLLRQFVMGLGFAHFQKMSDSSIAASMLAEKGQLKNIFWNTTDKDWTGYVMLKQRAVATYLHAVVSPQMRIAESVLQLAEDGSIDFEKLGI